MRYNRNIENSPQSIKSTDISGELMMPTTRCCNYIHCKEWKKNLIPKYCKTLKMLGLYLYTLIIGHKSCNMLSKLHKLILQKKLQNFVTNNVFWTKSKSTTTKSNIKTIARAGNLTRDLLHSRRMCYHCTTMSTENIDCCQAI